MFDAIEDFMSRCKEVVPCRAIIPSHYIAVRKGLILRQARRRWYRIRMVKDVSAFPVVVALDAAWKSPDNGLDELWRNAKLAR